jgi:regulator of sirC expression with transglutaminase-like and TPR domain
VTAPARSPRQQFVNELRRTEGEIDLARAALLIACEQYPQLPIDVYLGRLDNLAERVLERLEGETAPTLVLQELVATLFEREQFRGNRDAYYDPRNSFLNDVLDRRLGIPLTLGIVMLEVGWRLGLDLEGVNFPHHFLVRFRGESLSLLIDAYDGGEMRFEDQAQELLDRVYGGMVRLRPAFLASASRRDMLARLLSNLKGVYLNAHDDEKAISAVERILLIRPEAIGERKTLGLLLARRGRNDEALHHLTEYLESLPESSRDSRRIESLIDRIRAGETLGEDALEEEG